ncbi:HopJ type III effector protein [Vibrio sp. YMD68]|uniref:HopJ type III effector protein n=1 Tax=Vibrio sp. YMD68 TaxID=3042300 RepID=UPI00249ABDAF|nr:HopJ type III effector protein [Vibrio sp. YMD68]WGV98171.1 HopJ type III effector protein [Vibrio sp. YMD68]
MDLNTFISQLKREPELIEFEQTMSVIDENFRFTPTTFTNGKTLNQAGQNNGSCKIFALGELQQLSIEETLACFGRFYREDVLKHPEGDDHQNIRNFMVTGWDGVEFEAVALVKKV